MSWERNRREKGERRKRKEKEETKKDYEDAQ
jgi:hypothetical protein